MGDVIKRNTVFMECMTMKDITAFAAGEMVSVCRIENKWVTQESNGKYFRIDSSFLRKDEFFKINKQYSMSDIIYYLMDRNANYQTVAWEFLEEAVLTAFKEMRFYGATLNDIYNYIPDYLI